MRKTTTRTSVIVPPGTPAKTVGRRGFSLSATLPMLALIAVTFLVYAPAMNAGFMWDDDVLLTNNHLIKADDGLYRIWFSAENPDYFPLTSTMLWLEWRLWGTNPMGYHVVNIALHAISSVLIWLVLKKMAIPGAWYAAVLFAVHPVNVESVAWIAERKNTLPMVFYLLSILLYVRFRKSESQRYLWLSVFCFLLSLLGKTSVVMLPFVLLLYVWWRDGSIRRRDFISTIPFFALSLILGLVTVWFQYNINTGDEVVREDPLLSRLAVAGIAVWFYVYKALFPFRLSFVYPRWDLDSLSVFCFAPSLLILLVFLISWRHRAKWGRGILFGLGYYVLSLVPVLGFFNIYFMKYSLVADHWQYTAIIGVIGLVAGAAVSMFPRVEKSGRALLLGAMVAAACFLSVSANARARLFQEEHSLWGDTVKKNSESWLANVKAGSASLRKGRAEEAIHYYSNAIRLNPQSSVVLNNLGLALQIKGKIQEATVYYRKALAVRPDDPEALSNLGAALGDQGLYDQGKEYVSQALRLQPDHPRAHYNMAVLLAKRNRTDEALAHFERALTIQPNFPETHLMMGIAFGEKGDFQRAEFHLSEALKQNPSMPEAHYNLGLVLDSKGKPKEAITHYSKALELRPEYAKAHYNLALVLANLGKHEEALRHFRETVRIAPSFKEAYNNMGVFFFAQGDYRQAANSFSKALEVDPLYEEALKNLVHSEWLLGNKKDAMEAYARLKKINPHSAQEALFRTRGLPAPSSPSTGAGEVP